jgi:hypothetical protein
MAHLIKALAGSRKVPADLVAAALIGLGALLTFGAVVYRVFVEPEWTFEDALEALWPFVAAGVACLALGWLVDRFESLR